ncbi:MAG: hypothetical protein RLZZ196_1367 [Bacteroidota bacterium]|jgi:hypothetical protein
MEKRLFQIMNFGGLGPDEHAGIQLVDGYERYEFSQIKFINENGEVREVSITDADISHSDIQHILRNQDHRVEVTVDENSNVTLHF